MYDLPDQFMPHTITVEPILGEGAYGAVYGPGVAVRCNWEGSEQSASTGGHSGVVSHGTARTPLAPGVAIEPGARVTTPSGSTTHVIRTIPRDGGGLDVWQYLEVICQ